jgi:hypothetical protein
MPDFSNDHTQHLNSPIVSVSLNDKNFCDISNRVRVSEPVFLENLGRGHQEERVTGLENNTSKLLVNFMHSGMANNIIDTLSTMHHHFRAKFSGSNAGRSVT